MVNAARQCVSCVNFRGSFFVSQHSSCCFRTTTMADICHISVNTGQICMEFEADTSEIIETCPPYETFGQISGLKVIDEQTHFFPGMGLHREVMKHKKLAIFLMFVCLMYSLKQFECCKNEAERNFV